ncbi:MAG: NAD-dependent epimerase/dehydratase family protein [Candidatus Rokubacteria bacterium]|nr:NAD-dependent epimerase/dehydratase family protein [Candidatus Rokubacteria bacterium]
MSFYRGKKVLLAGGAGFIGTHVLDRLIDLGAHVTVADNLSSGSRDAVLEVWRKHGFEYQGSTHRQTIEADHQRFQWCDLEDISQARRAMAGQEVVIHVAAVIGGRGFVDTRPADCCGSFGINHSTFKAAWEAGVDRVHYASTACVYPESLQNSYDSDYLLQEDDAFRDGIASCDRAYGWAKFMGELELEAYHDQYGLKGSICRYVTAYGDRENDTHAIIALIKRAVERRDPYVVWGSGEQDRDFTFVDDIVEGTLLATENITDCTPINLGTARRYKIKDVVKTILRLVGHEPRQLVFDPTKPVGVLSRALDNRRAKQLLDWEPRYDLHEGLRRTIEWYVAARPRSVETLV